MIDGRARTPSRQDPGRHADVYLDAGTHDLTIFAAAGAATPTLEARWATGDATARARDAGRRSARPTSTSARPEAKTAAAPRAARRGDHRQGRHGVGVQVPGRRRPPRPRRDPRVPRRGGGDQPRRDPGQREERHLHIPTEADLLSLATNDILEIGGGDVVTATYIDDVNLSDASRLLTAKLTATYHNATITPSPTTLEGPNGQVVQRPQGTAADRSGRAHRNRSHRLRPGHHRRPGQDQGAGRRQRRPAGRAWRPTETQENSGVFTKEVDTAAAAAEGKLVVKPGDRVVLRYLDQQNTVPGHAAFREAVVYVSEPTPGRVRVIETRATRPPVRLGVPAPVVAAAPVLLPPAAGRRPGPEGRRRGRVRGPVHRRGDRPRRGQGQPEQGDGQAEDDGRGRGRGRVRDRRPAARHTGTADRHGTALLEGRFTGQVVMQLGGKESLSLVPLTAAMPRDLIGGPKLPKEEEGDAAKQPRPGDRHPRAEPDRGRRGRGHLRGRAAARRPGRPARRQRPAC